MNSTNEYKQWLCYFSNLGSRTVPRANKNVWMDLEHFIILGCKYALDDPRMFTSFTILCSSLAPVVSPFKLKKIAKIILAKDEYRVMGFLVTKIQQNVRNTAQWNSLIEFCRSKITDESKVNLFGNKSFRKEEELFEWGLVSSKLEFDQVDKYINIKKLYRHTLVNLRLLGVKTVFADITFYRQFYGGEESLNKTSIAIYHDYNTVYQANELIEIAT